MFVEQPRLHRVGNDMTNISGIGCGRKATTQAKQNPFLMKTEVSCTAHKSEVSCGQLLLQEFAFTDYFPSRTNYNLKASQTFSFKLILTLVIYKCSLFSIDAFTFYTIHQTRKSWPSKNPRCGFYWTFGDNYISYLKTASKTIETMQINVNNGLILTVSPKKKICLNSLFFYIYEWECRWCEWFWLSYHQVNFF